MINLILNGIINLIMGLVNIVTAPIDALITQFLPDVSTAINAVGSFFTTISSSIGWVISLSGISSTAISIIVLYFTFKLTAPVVFMSIKFAIKWYRSLKI